MKNVIHGNNIEILKTLDSDSIDSIVTDPPYGINFLGKDWDANTGALETYRECLRVLKPGGHILAFSAARTYHHLAITLEQAGFEIRDQLMWLYASGFPKAQDIGKAIDKRMGKKDPNFKGTETFNLTFGENPGQRLCAVCKKDQTNVYKCDREDCGQKYQTQTPQAQQWAGWKTALKPAHEPICMARKPFKGSTIDNVLEHGVGALNIDATRIETDDTRSGRYPSNVLGEVEGYQKYFYCPKVSRKERHIGFEQLPEPEPFNNPEEMKKHPLWDPSIGTNSHRLTEKIRKHQAVGNNHPTVKPLALMEYLITLVTPKEGTVLDPFMGSGSTGMAACGLGYNFIGIELDAQYCQIAETRIEGWCKDSNNNNFSDLFEDDN